ncbi:acyl-CoA dehydrogenase family protein, partial [Candidatus Cloacimonadota bacterium]
MINFALDTNQLAIQEKYRDFADRLIRPNRMKYDESCEFPWDIVKQAY